MLLFRLAAVLWLIATCAAPAEAADDRPNIVWLVVEDMLPHFGCYGEKTIDTPNVDRLAAGGVRFSNAVCTGPVCSASRSALITGMYQTSIGAHHHRSGRGKLKIQLPEGVELVPRLFQKVGYRTLNLTVQDFVKPNAAGAAMKVAKTDYNFEWNNNVYDDEHWSADSERPFFVQVQLNGGKLRHNRRWPAIVARDLGSATPVSAVRLPPDLPADPVILEDWAQYLDAVRYTDWEVGKVIDRLRTAGELENTYIFFITDHGISHVRHKQFCYDGGLSVPLVISGPGIEAGQIRNDPVEQIDLAATSLTLAGIDIPRQMQSRDILADDYQKRQYTFSARDRCDETVDRIRAVRSPQWKYIRNFLPNRPYLQPNRYKDNKPIVQAMRQLHAAGKLNEVQSLVMAERRPTEELYDLRADPYELNNLAGDPRHQEQLETMRRELQAWMERTGDQGRQPESTAMYQSDMNVYLGNSPDQVVLQNIEQMKQYAARERLEP